VRGGPLPAVFRFRGGRRARDLPRPGFVWMVPCRDVFHARSHILQHTVPENKLALGRWGLRRGPGFCPSGKRSPPPQPLNPRSCAPWWARTTVYHAIVFGELGSNGTNPAATRTFSASIGLIRDAFIGGIDFEDQPDRDHHLEVFPIVLPLRPCLDQPRQEEATRIPSSPLPRMTRPPSGTAARFPGGARRSAANADLARPRHTFVSTMFMMPMPPTNSEIAGDRHHHY